MPRKARKASKKIMVGAGFFSSLGNAFKSIGNTVASNAGRINGLVKDSGLVSSYASKFNPLLGAVVKQTGYGRKKRRVVRGRGDALSGRARSSRLVM